MHSPCFSEIPWLLAKLLHPFVGDISIHPFFEVIILAIVFILQRCVLCSMLWLLNYVRSTLYLSVIFVSWPKHNYPNALFGQLFCFWTSYLAADYRL